MDTINIINPTFVIGDWQPDIFQQFGELDVRPIYGPENANGERPLVGVIRANDERADLVNYIERLSEMLDFADAQMPKEPDVK